MIGIFEAGGTKTEFRFGNFEETGSANGSGINPYFQSDEEIRLRLGQIIETLPEEIQKMERIFYYGAGCSKKEQANRILEILKFYFSKARIEVASDLLGSCRGLCHNNKGIVAILGTGSNACLFDGTKISDQIFSFGFWLGDEGSGGYLGKMIFKDWLLNRIPEEFEPEIESTFGYPKETALENLYSDKNPNRSIAALSKIAIRNKTHIFFKDKVEKSTLDFFNLIEPQFGKQKELPLHFTGSVAWYLKEEIKAIFEERGFKVTSIIQNPSINLFNFHMNTTL